MTRTYNDRRNEITASAGQTAFTWDWRLDNAADMVITKKVKIGGAISTLVITTDYTIPAGDVGAEGGGTVTLVVAAAVDDLFILEDNRQPERAQDYTTSGDLLADTIDGDQDRRVDIIMNHERQLDRSLHLAPIELNTVNPQLPVASAGKSWRWDSAATAIEDFTPLGDPGDDVARCFGADKDYCIVYDSIQDRLEIRDQAGAELFAIGDASNTIVKNTTFSGTLTVDGVSTLTGNATIAGILTIADGTAAAPGIRTTTTAHGMFEKNATNLGFSVAGTEQVTFSTVTASFVNDMQIQVDKGVKTGVATAATGNGFVLFSASHTANDSTADIVTIKGGSTNRSDSSLEVRGTGLLAENFAKTLEKALRLGGLTIELEVAGVSELQVSGTAVTIATNNLVVSAGDVTVTGAISCTTTLTVDTTSTLTGDVTMSADLTVSTGDVIVTAGGLAVGVATPLTEIHAASTTQSILTLERIDTSVAFLNSIGEINFRGGESTIAAVGQIQVKADNTWANDDSPTRMVFLTTPVASTTALEALRLDSAQNVTMSSLAGSGSRTVVADANGKLSAP